MYRTTELYEPAGRNLASGLRHVSKRYTCSHRHPAGYGEGHTFILEADTVEAIEEWLIPAQNQCGPVCNDWHYNHMRRLVLECRIEAAE